MASRWTEIVVDSHDPRALAQFWADVLGWHVVYDTPDEVEVAPWPEEPADLKEQIVAASPVPTLLFTPVPEGKTVKNRLHIDVRPIDRSTAEEVDRILALGATRAEVGQTGEESWTVLADPEGNEFCVLRPVMES